MISRDGGDDDDDTPLFRKTKAEETKTKPVREKKTKSKRKKGSRHGSFVIRMFSFIFSHVFCFFGVVWSLVSHERNSWTHWKQRQEHTKRVVLVVLHFALFFCVFHVLCYFSSAKVTLAFVLVFFKTTLVCSSRNLQLQLVINVRIW